MFLTPKPVIVGWLAWMGCSASNTTPEPDTGEVSNPFPECALPQPCPIYEGGIVDDVGVLRCIFDALVAQEPARVSFYLDSGDSTTTFEFRIGYDDGLVRQRRFGHLNGSGSFDETFQCTLKSADYFNACIADNDFLCFDPYAWCETTVRDGAPTCPP